jgi:hypothetical protein
MKQEQYLHLIVNLFYDVNLPCYHTKLQATQFASHLKHLSWYQTTRRVLEKKTHLSKLRHSKLHLLYLGMEFQMDIDERRHNNFCPPPNLAGLLDKIHNRKKKDKYPGLNDVQINTFFHDKDSVLYNSEALWRVPSITVSVVHKM